MVSNAEHEQPLNLSPFWKCMWADSPGDFYVSLANEYYDGVSSQSAAPPLVELERDFEKAGIPGLPTLYEEQPFVGLRDEITITQRSRYVGTTRGSATKSSTLPETCFPLHTDRTRAASERSISHLPPSIFACIRKVLSSNPSFASGVISAIHRLPSYKRDVLIDHDATDNTDCPDGSSTGTSRSFEKDPKRRRTARNNSKKGRGKEPPDGDGVGGDDGDGNGRNGGDGASSSSTKGSNEDKGRRWICPYHLAYPEVYWIPHLKDCSPGNMVDPNEWRKHLNTHHSPEAKTKHLAKNKGLDANMIAKFYMNDATLKAVLQEISSHTKRPRGDDRNKYRTDVFVKVWNMIFPKDKFPDFNEPLSAFHCEDMNLGDRLAKQAETLLDAMYDTKAVEALNSGAPNLLPTATETKEYMAKAIAIVLLNEPAATGPTQWLARASSQAVKVAGREYSTGSASTSMTTSFDEVPRAGEPAVNPTVSDRSHPVPGTGHLWPIQLFPNGTWTEVLPCNSTFTQEAYLTLSPNATRPGPGLSNAAPMMSPAFGNAFYNTLQTPVPTQQASWDPSIHSGSQDVSLQEIEGGAAVSQEFGI
ncbi:uncharacterized protein FIESC28_11210 [Fusarium coffeatum]|uniref:Uncharacterized protein n=1 Tax=Fusarium coffeatum TaxID=231269 RepID=A0A366QMR2_9HYPO|nr:uncharacterized protein FIESC28_11210 [Fusarium coffeatum]RBR06032.1 hypothetical protein FIESC28_11210 [Fusarium coffeatum]